MKKIYIFVLSIIVIFSLAACGKEDNTDSSLTEATSTTEATIEDTEEDLEPEYEINLEYEIDPLVSAYCNGKWDGEFISNGEHCASIDEDGYLWIDCWKSDTIPDMYNTNYTDVIPYYSDDETLELWTEGICYARITLPFPRNYYTSVYTLPEVVVARYGSMIMLYNINDGSYIDGVNNVIDFYYCQDELFYSTFDHRNYKIYGDGSIEELETNYIRFPRENAEVINKDPILAHPILAQAYNLYYSTGWDGSTKIIGDNFVAVDNDTGNIIVNNEIVGNVSLGTDFVASKERENLILGPEKSYWLNGTELVVYDHGVVSKVNIPDGNGEFLWKSEEWFVIQVYGEKSNTVLVVDPDRNIRIVTKKALDAHVAYETLYYMEDDTVVYSLVWDSADSVPEKFFEGAYAVAPFVDEARGAIVPNDYRNYSDYGYTNIYSPYGE